MRRMSQRLHRAATKLALIATAGVMFQTAGCQVEPSGVFENVSSTFLTTLISSFVNDQFGVSNSLFF